MKKAILAALGIAALGLGGCANVDAWLQTNVINPGAALIQNPNTAIVVNALKQDSIAATCVMAEGSSLFAAIYKAAGAGASLQGTNMKFYAVNETLCTGLGAVFNGSATVPAGTPVVTSASGA